MPSPVVYTDIPVFNAQSDLCDKLELLLRTSDRMRDLLEYMFTQGGAISDDFAADLKLKMQPMIGVPTGRVIASPISAVPDGYLICNGASYDRTVYADLFQEIGTTFGFESATTFKVPNYSGRFLIGSGGGYAVGQTGGSATQTLAKSNLPAEGLDIPIPVSATAANDNGSGELACGDASSVGNEPVPGPTLTSEDMGSGAAFDILPPYNTVLWLIKY